ASRLRLLRREPFVYRCARCPGRTPRSHIPLLLCCSGATGFGGFKQRRWGRLRTVPDAFDLFLFSTEPGLIRTTVAAGVTGIVVDWERAGKRERQRGADTEINHDTAEDLRRVRASTQATVLCRINGVGETTEDEVALAAEAGADEARGPMGRAGEVGGRVLGA